MAIGQRLDIINISKYYGDFKVLDSINIVCEPGEFVTILGSSGSGKTTLLKVIAGFEGNSDGSILINKTDIAAKKAYERNIGMLFQNYALFPHMTVEENIAYPLKLRKVPKDEIKKRVAEILEVVKLSNMGKRYPKQLSGGQQQRVALARAIVYNPPLLLLDEPLGALDLKLRKEMQRELKKIQKEVGITFIFVTHDQEEALTMSDKIVVMKDGEIQQVGSPTNIYNEPVNKYVANFIGESNIIEGIMRDDYKVAFNGKLFDCVDYGFEKDERVDVVIRPEDIDIVPLNEGKITGKVKSVLFKGVHYETMVEVRTGTSITVKMKVDDVKPVVNESSNESITANDFYLDISDIEEELTRADIIARANAQAWKTDDEEQLISITKVDYDIKPEKGSYDVTFATSSGTTKTVQAIVADENKVEATEYDEIIYAVNIYKDIDDIKESMVLDTDLKTWANAQAWTKDGSESIDITDVEYNFDPENITPGIYEITFKTRGAEYKIDTTDEHNVGDKVGLTFTPDDIHIMSKEGF